MQKLGPNQIKWIEALESGEYEQGKFWLCRNDEYCCLGVAAKLFADDTTKIELADDNVCFNGEQAVAPQYVVDALSLGGPAGNPIIEDPDLKALYELNDFEDYTFHQITALLRKNPGHYFTKES